MLAEDILSLPRAQGLDEDVNVDPRYADLRGARELDAHLCDLKEMQIRDGLHILGRGPAGRAAQLVTLMVASRASRASDVQAAGCVAASAPWRSISGLAASIR